MAKKKVKETKKTTAKPTKHVPWTQKERLEQLIYFSKRCMNGHGGELDKLMQSQVDCAEKELKALKKGKAK